MDTPAVPPDVPGVFYTETFDCGAEADGDADYGLRIAALFAILVVSFIGASLPWVFQSSKLRRVSFNP